MTDDISKVVKFLLGEGELRGAWFGDEPPGALGPMPRFWWRKDLRAAFARLESATTPAEVEEDWQLIDGHRSPDGMTYTATYWCANTGALKTETTSDGRFRAGEGPRIRRPTLARQLAEAKEGEATRKSEVKYWFNAAGAANTRAEQAESQLAETTRRLGEVETLRTENEKLQAALRKIADWHGDFGAFPETNNAWRAMVIVTAREAVSAIDTARATGEGEKPGS